MNLLQPDLPPEGADFTMMCAELEALKKEQMEGKWKPEAFESWKSPGMITEYDDRGLRNGPKHEIPQTRDGFELWVSFKIREGTALTAMLRRTNTGPANSKKKPSKKTANMEAVRAALLE